MSRIDAIAYFAACLAVTLQPAASADLKVSNVFGDHMEAQLRVHLTTPKTGFAVTEDDVHSDLHVLRKRSIAERAARWAFADVDPSGSEAGPQPGRQCSRARGEARRGPTGEAQAQGAQHRQCPGRGRPGESLSSGRSA